MVDAVQVERARRFRELHAGGVLVLPNAWDAASAAIVAAAGAEAVATTSGGVAWSLGRPDGQGLGRQAMVAAVARIAGAVDVPVTADVEGGYGAGPDAVAATVAGVVGAGAVGVNLEDSRAGEGALFAVAEQAERLTAARQAAAGAGLPDLFVNARTDVFLFRIGDPDGRLEDVLERARAYAAAGADGLFVPGLLDLGTLRELTSRSPLPVNAMAGPGAPTVAELAAAGVRRVSVGTAIAQAAYQVARDGAVELLRSGSYAPLATTLDYGELNKLVARG
jgi:2-methylisocitrate lyase-like PEP mutase family enzyme